MQPKVLFVDDEPLSLESFRAALRREPYEVLAAGSGEEALEAVARHAIDVVVSDEHMPGMSGSDLLARIRADRPDVVRILLTGLPTLETAVSAINRGEVYRFLVKPVGPLDLIATLRGAAELRRIGTASSRLLREAKRRRTRLERLEREYPGITEVRRTADGGIVVGEQAATLEELAREMEAEAASSESGRREES